MLPTQKDFEIYNSHAKQIIDSIDLSAKLEIQKSLQLELASPAIWDDPINASSLNQQCSAVTKEIEEIQNITSLLENLQICFELKDENEFDNLKPILDQELENLQNKQFLSGKFDSQGAYLSLFAGAGGLDAQDWSSMLCSMYQAFAKSQGFSCSLMAISLGEEGGIKTATLEIKGQNVYGLLKEEAGVHRLVRISPFNSGGTRETSFAMVEVIPNNLSTQIDINIDEKDIRIDTFMSSGKGGQGVNTTYSAVRIVHLPTNITVQCQDERSQIDNKRRAMEVLTNKLATIELQKQKEFAKEIKGNLGQNEWGSQIRSYTLHPYKLVKDHRSNYEEANVTKVIDNGELLPFIWAMKRVK
jgi:peptide chain release factor 2